jgi:cytochrome b involved in lipid metabolism
VSNWTEHPGGRVIFTLAGRDATDVFRGFHSAAGWDALSSRQVGVVEALKPSPFEQDILSLRQEFKKNGWFEAR